MTWWDQKIFGEFYLLSGGPLFRFVLEHPFDGFLGGVGDVLWHAELPSSDGMEEFLVGFTFRRMNKGNFLGFTIEGVVASEHFVQEDTERPDVYRLAEVVFLGYQLWGHVGGRAAVEVELFAWLRKETETEVDDLDVVVFIDHNVVQLDVAVSYLLAVEVLDAHYDPTEDLLCLLLTNTLLRLALQVLVERGLADVLHHQYHLLARVDRSV